MIAVKIPITYPALQPGNITGTLFIRQNKKTQSLSFTEDHDGRTFSPFSSTSFKTAS